MAFKLDPRLEESSFFITDWPLCKVALRNDKTYTPWLYLVPRRENIREIYQLDKADQQQLQTEIAQAQKAIDTLYKPAKINTAALGNMVPQLHVHIFARYEKDPAWPRPVWAVQGDEIPYTDSEKDGVIGKLKEYFASMTEGA